MERKIKVYAFVSYGDTNIYVPVICVHSYACADRHYNLGKPNDSLFGPEKDKCHYKIKLGGVKNSKPKKAFVKVLNIFITSTWMCSTFKIHTFHNRLVY